MLADRHAVRCQRYGHDVLNEQKDERADYDPWRTGYGASLRHFLSAELPMERIPGPSMRLC